MTTLHPGAIKELSPFNAFPVAKEIVIFHDKNTIVLLKGHQNPGLKAIRAYQTYAESVVQSFQRVKPLTAPLFWPVTPSTGPFTLTPRIPDFDEPFPTEFDGGENGVSMIYGKL